MTFLAGEKGVSFHQRERGSAPVITRGGEPLSPRKGVSLCHCVRGSTSVALRGIQLLSPPSVANDIAVPPFSSALQEVMSVRLSVTQDRVCFCTLFFSFSFFYLFTLSFFFHSTSMPALQQSNLHVCFSFSPFFVGYINGLPSISSFCH